MRAGGTSRQEGGWLRGQGSGEMEEEEQEGQRPHATGELWLAKRSSAGFQVIQYMVLSSRSTTMHKMVARGRAAKKPSCSEHHH